MKRVLLICILLLALASQYAKSQQESGWIDKGTYLENKLITSQFTSVQFSPDGKTILTYGFDQFLRKWDTETGILLKEIDMSNYAINMYDFSSDNKFFIFINDSIYIFDIINEKIICSMVVSIHVSQPMLTSFEIQMIKSHPKYNRFLVFAKCDFSYSNSSWYLRGVNAEFNIDSCNYFKNIDGLIPYNFEFSPDGKKFIISGYSESSRSNYHDGPDEYLYRYNLELYYIEKDSSYTLDSYETEIRNNIPDKKLLPCFSMDSKQLAICRNKKINIYDASNGELLRVLDDNIEMNYIIKKVMYSVDNNFLIKCGNVNGASIQFIPLNNGIYKEDIVIPAFTGTCYDQSPDSSSYLIGTSNGRLILIKDHYTNTPEKLTQSKQISIYPNPANDKAQINFSLAENSNVKIIMFDFMGNEIKTIVDDNRNAGDYVESFDTGFLTEGMYFLKLLTGTETSLFKLMINR